MSGPTRVVATLGDITRCVFVCFSAADLADYLAAGVPEDPSAGSASG